jgi:acyl carrier protein
MNNDKLINDIKEIFKIIFKINLSKIGKKTSYKNVKSWDSLNHVKLIMALESKFKLSIDPNDGIKLLSFVIVCNYIQKKMK